MISKAFAFKLMLGILIAVACQGKLTAQILTSLNPSAPIVINSIPTSSAGPSNTGTTATDGYYFFYDKLGTLGPNGDVFSLPTYVTGVNIGANQLYAGNYTNLSINGNSYGTGVVYNSVSTLNPTINLFTVNLGNSVPADFNFGIASVYGGETSSYNLTLYNSSNTLLSTTTIANTFTNPSTGGANGTNSFLFADVSGAAAGDYLVVSATGTNQVTLGGVTFDSVVSAPEPSTWALMLGGLGLLVYFQRRARRA